MPPDNNQGNMGALLSALDSIAIALQNQTDVPVGEWVELARHTWSSGSSMSSGSFAVKKYLKIVIVNTEGSALGIDLRFNGDSGSNYAYNRSLTDAAFSGVTSGTLVEVMGNFKGPGQSIIEMFNYPTLEKIGMAQWTTAPQSGTVNSAAQIPTYGVYALKWVNTTNAITSVEAIHRSATNFAAGTEMIIYGHD